MSDRAAATNRKNSFLLFKEAQKLWPYDEFPMLGASIDPQLILNKNDHDQPFFLKFEKDSVLAQVSGSAQVVLRHSHVRCFDLEPGDFVYIPGGVPHRILTDESVIQYRYKARDAGREAAHWYCKQCDHSLFEHGWDCATLLPQEGYAEAVTRFNAVACRPCPVCKAIAEGVDASRYRWPEVAAHLRAQSS